MKQKIANWCLRHLFNAVTEDDVLRLNKRGRLVFRDNELNEKAIRDISSQAKTLKTLALQKMLMQEMKYLANRRMFEAGKNTDDIMFGKAMLYTVDIIEKKIEHLSKM